MKKTLFNVLIFAAGAVAGSAVTWKIVKTKYERIAQEEIDSVKEAWARRLIQEVTEESPNKVDYDCEEEDDCDEDDYDPVMTMYQNLAGMYAKASSVDDAENDGEGEGDEDEEVPYVNGPYVITPNDFGDGNYEHDMYGLTYYADGVLANDWYQTFDIEETIGEESLEHFSEYAEDVLHVRNERLSADYEIVRDPRNFADLLANDPLMGDYEN